MGRKMKTPMWMILAAFVVLAPSVLPAADQVTELVFIVNAANPAAELSTNEIREIYFKRKRHWPDGESVRFIDRSPSSYLREFFLKRVIKKSNSDVELFWIGQKLYTGDSAPLRESSDYATIQFVSSFKGAIGYVSPEVSLADKNVKVIKIVVFSED